MEQKEVHVAIHEGDIELESKDNKDSAQEGVEVSIHEAEADTERENQDDKDSDEEEDADQTSCLVLFTIRQRESKPLFYFLVTLLVVFGALQFIEWNDHEVALGTIFGLCFWTCFYMLVTNWAELNTPDGTKMWPPGSIFSVGSYYVSLIHQGLFCVSFLVYFMVANRDDLHEWWIGEWGEWSYMIERHSILCTVGYELKDVLRGSINPTFLLHHIFVFLGSALVLTIPCGVGIVLVNSMNAEIGSAVFNLYELRPSLLTFVVFMIGMNASNGIAWWMVAELLDIDELNDVWKILYSLICGALVLLRSIGVIIAVVHRCKIEEAPLYDETNVSTLEDQENEQKTQDSAEKAKTTASSE